MIFLQAWRPRKAAGIIQSKSKDLRTRGAGDINPSLRAGGDEMSQLSEVEFGEWWILPFSTFCFIQSLCRLKCSATMVEGQGSLACCSPWDRRELDMTEWLNNHHPSGESSLLSPSIQILIPPGNIIEEIPRTMFNLGTCGSLKPTDKINYHNLF